MSSSTARSSTRRAKAFAAIAAFAGTLAVLPAGPADARSADGVSVCSRYGGRCVSAPVRTGRFDNEIRLPGGTWIECKRDCRNTLREETVDFFETIRERSGGNGHRR